MAAAAPGRVGPATCAARELSYLPEILVLRSRKRVGWLSYEDMARSHVKELVREAFELDEVVVDGDGDLPFPHGTAMFYLSVIRGGRLLRVWSLAVNDIRVGKRVLREINDVNAGLTLARVHATSSAVWVEACWPVDGLQARDVGFLCAEVGGTADRLGSMLAAVHGGLVARPDAAEVDHECED